VAARVTRHVDTVDIAGIAFQLSCRFAKPRFWARRHPEFMTHRRPDVIVRIEYGERFRDRAGRPVGETVADAADVRRQGRGLVVSTGYYRAAVDARRGRVDVRMAAFFDVAGLMRTLAALWLLERETLLIRGACFGPRVSTTLVCGSSDRAAPSSALGGWFAVTPRADGINLQPTPFVDRDGPLDAGGRRATGLWLPGAPEETARTAHAGAHDTGPAGIHRTSPAMALQALLPSVWQADRRRPALERTLDLATRVVTALGCSQPGAADHAREEAAVG
jgi:hypothetical protein